MSKTSFVQKIVDMFRTNHSRPELEYPIDLAGDQCQVVSYDELTNTAVLRVEHPQIFPMFIGDLNATLEELGFHATADVFSWLDTSNVLMETQIRVIPSADVPEDIKHVVEFLGYHLAVQLEKYKESLCV